VPVVGPPGPGPRSVVGSGQRFYAAPAVKPARVALTPVRIVLDAVRRLAARVLGREPSEPKRRGLHRR